MRIQFSEAEDHSADIVIIGAGISGLYCAWRLIEHDPTRSITIVDRLNRTGGRLDTDLIEVKPGQLVREEEGGMRFNYDMTELMQVVSALDLCDEIVPFPMASDVPGHGNTNRFFLRGRRFSNFEAAQGGNVIWSEIYRLDESEKKLSPTDIVTNAYQAVLEQNGWTQPKQSTPEYWKEFRETCSWNGVPLNQWQMWGLLRDMGHSHECIQMLSESIGFAGPFKAPINAGDAFQILADFPKDPSYSTFRCGFSTLPNAVADRLDGKVQIVLSANVDRIVREGDRFELTLTKAPDGESANPHIPGGATKKIKADTLICAVATTGMEQLFMTSPALSAQSDAERLWDSIHAAKGMALMKINLYFEEPWWENGLIDPPVQFGPNFSDLPINAVYPFYAIQDPDPALSAEESSLHQAAALTIYCDFDNTHFWEGLQNVGDLFDSPLQRRQNAQSPQVLFAASKQVVREARIQIGALFGCEVPEPVLTSYRLWDGTNDFEHAYHQWRLGVVDSEVRAYLAAPIKGINFCNEAISDMQGWVNGSLRSANLVLEALGVPAMDEPPCAKPTKPETTTTPAIRTSGLWGG
ncbi:flavin monoamine oxidase family protein [Roseovarius sp.]|uniref:flavin monoamine oxidase family protein n=1 Tax=Roseovarius sp. TaxID=1486281 RepID=UPI003565FA05